MDFLQSHHKPMNLANILHNSSRRLMKQGMMVSEEIGKYIGESSYFPMSRKAQKGVFYKNFFSFLAKKILRWYASSLIKTKFKYRYKVKSTR
jgi:hypothetical protein